MDVERILERLTKVKKSGPGKWMACCPSHEDRSPSLAIKEVDGTVLLHCFALCPVEDVVSAIGLEMTDLFPPSDKREWVQGTERPVKFGNGLKFQAMDALRCLAGEGSVVLLMACDAAEGKVLTPAEIDRMVLAVGRIEASLSYLGDDEIERITTL